MMEDLLGHMEDIEAVNDEEQIEQAGSAAEDEEEAAHDLSDEWAAKRDLITKLYWTDKRTLREVRRVLMEDHGFDKTYGSQFRRCTTSLSDIHSQSEAIQDPARQMELNQERQRPGNGSYCTQAAT